MYEATYPFARSATAGRNPSDSILPAIERGVIRFIGSTPKTMISMTGHAPLRLVPVCAPDREDVKRCGARGHVRRRNG